MLHVSTAAMYPQPLHPVLIVGWHAHNQLCAAADMTACVMAGKPAAAWAAAQVGPQTWTLQSCMC